MGLFLAFATALAVSARDLLAKRLVRGNDSILPAWCTAAFSLPIIGAWHLATQEFDLRLGFWLAFFVGGGLNALAQFMYFRALKVSDLSLSIPFLALTPAFLLMTSPLILGEQIGNWQQLGVLSIAIGAYVLNLAESKQGIFAPLRAIFSNMGSRLMLLVAFIWSVSANFDKVGVVNSSPLTWAFASNLMVVLALFPASRIWEKATFLRAKEQFKDLAIIGIANAAVYLLHMHALLFVPVSFLIPIKRTSVLWSVLFGSFFLKEAGLKERLVGALFMVLGVVLISAL